MYWTGLESNDNRMTTAAAKGKLPWVWNDVATYYRPDASGECGQNDKALNYIIMEIISVISIIMTYAPTKP
jgi:hypothetical protein